MVKCFSEKSGFFDGYKDYLFIRKKENSYITCIPRSPGKVKFQKDGKDLKLSENNKDDVYRTDYAIWFRNPLEENSGDYSCLMEDDTSIKVTKNLRVIGESFFQQNFSVKLKFQVLIVDRDFFSERRVQFFQLQNREVLFKLVMPAYYDAFLFSASSTDLENSPEALIFDTLRSISSQLREAS